MNTRIPRLAPLLLALPLAQLHAADAGPAAQRQEQIETDAKQLVARLNTIVEEYRRNGLATGSDYTALQNLHAALGSLSDQEMVKVVSMLRDAGIASDPAQALQKMTAAYGTERDISLKLKNLVMAYERGQAMEEIGDALAQLADRQSANWTAASGLAALAQSTRDGQLPEAASAAADGQKEEQSSIAAEMKQDAVKLAQAGGDPKLAAAAAALNALMPTATGAADALGNRQLPQAAAAERDNATALRQIANSLATPASLARSQERAAAQIGQIEKDQQALARDTADLNRQLAEKANELSPAGLQKDLQDNIQRDHDLAEKIANEGLSASSPLDQLKTSPEVQSHIEHHTGRLQKEQQDLQKQLADSAARQNELATQTGDVARQMAGQPAATPLNAALANMQAAQNALQQQNGAAALNQQNAAAAQLAAAAGQQANAQQQNAAAADGQQPRATPQQIQAMLAAEKQVQQIQLLIRDERQMQVETAAARQRASNRPETYIANNQAEVRKLTDAYRQAPAMQPEAAADLANASQQMGNAVDKLNKPDQAAAGNDERAALDALEKAEEAQAAQMTAAAQAAGNPNEANNDNNAAAALQRAQAAAQAAQNALAGAQAAGQQPSEPQVGGQLNQAMGDADQAMQTPDLPADAQQAIGQAQQALAQAKTAMGGQDAQAAQQAAGQAQKALAAAQAAMNNAQAGIAQTQQGVPAGTMAQNNQGQGQGEEQQGQGQGQQQGQGQGQQQGQGQGEQQGQGQGQSPPQGGQAAQENGWQDRGGQVAGATQGASGAAHFTGLPQRDREAIRQSQSEKYPQEYGSSVEQYMQGLAEDAQGGTQSR